MPTPAYQYVSYKTVVLKGWLAQPSRRQPDPILYFQAHDSADAYVLVVVLLGHASSVSRVGYSTRQVMQA